MLLIQYIRSSPNYQKVDSLAWDPGSAKMFLNMYCCMSNTHLNSLLGTRSEADTHIELLPGTALVPAFMGIAQEIYRSLLGPLWLLV